MDKTDRLQFSVANILVGDRLITDFPTEISIGHIKTNSHGTIPVAAIRYIKIEKHKDQCLERYGCETVTAKMLLDWPVVVGRLASPEKRSIEEQTRAGKILVEILKERKQKPRQKLLRRNLARCYSAKTQSPVS